MNQNLNPTAIDDLSLQDLAALSASDLAWLQARVGEDMRTLKARSEKLNAAMERRYQDAARAAYLQAGKDTGTIHLDDAGADVEVRIEKKVEWDQDALATVLDALPVEMARHYAKAAFIIPEAKFLNAPPELQAAFSRARTVKSGPMRIVIKLREAA